MDTVYYRKNWVDITTGCQAEKTNDTAKIHLFLGNPSEKVYKLARSATPPDPREEPIRPFRSSFSRLFRLPTLHLSISTGATVSFAGIPW